MSYGSAYSLLFVEVKTLDQRKELIAQFQEEKPGCGMFFIDQEFDPQSLRIDIQFDQEDAPTALNDHIKELERWLRNNFDLPLQGYWIFEGDDTYRCEIAKGKIEEEPLNWLSRYPVQKIRALRAYASGKGVIPGDVDGVCRCPDCGSTDMKLDAMNKSDPDLRIEYDYLCCCQNCGCVWYDRYKRDCRIVMKRVGNCIRIL